MKFQVALTVLFLGLSVDGLAAANPSTCVNLAGKWGGTPSAPNETIIQQGCEQIITDIFNGEGFDGLRAFPVDGTTIYRTDDGFSPTPFASFSYGTEAFLADLSVLIVHFYYQDAKTLKITPA